MKALLTFCTILFVSILGFAQDSIATKRQKFAIGIHYSPDYCFRTLENNNENSVTSSIVEKRNSNETPYIGFSTGINFSFSFNKFLFSSIGVNYSQNGYKTKWMDLTFGATRINPVVTTGKGRFIYSYRYLNIPINIGTSIENKKIKFKTSIGCSVDFFIEEKTISTIKYDTGETDIKKTKNTSDDFNSTNLSALATIGVEVRLVKNLSLGIEPYFKYGLLKIVDTPVTAYLWNAGMNISCNYRF